MEDLGLWKNIKDGNKAALKRLHSKYFYQMYLYAIKSTHGNPGLAEELVSDCFMKIWEHRKDIEIQTSVEHYLFLMLHNAIVDHFRKKRIVTEPLIKDFMAPVSEKDFDDQKQYARLYKAVKKLPSQCRTILELAVYESLSYQEIADKLNISRNTVKTQMGRAYKHLREMLDPKDFNFFLVIRKSGSL
ncbi:MAG TPA: sigma-70 family RNA polymerase sigma factor [Tangfeifania sp.]|nr:sigma-70 family RNA polymerase sigma factor [Tangfeifania sp.]